MLGDGYCDWQCNTTYCDWDKKDCLNTGNQTGICHLFNFTSNATATTPTTTSDTFFDVNYTDIYYNSSINDGESIYACYYSWIDDLWCDAACFEAGDDCNSDGSDCDYCSANCASLYSLWSVGDENADDRLSESEICNIFGIVEQFIDFDELNITRCEQVIAVVDADGDNLGSFSEILKIGANQLDLSQEKVNQIDCSSCLHNASRY